MRESIRLETGHKLDYYFGDLVYLKSDPEQRMRIVVGVLLSPDKCVCYQLACGEVVSTHYYVEISTDKNVML